MTGGCTALVALFIMGKLYVANAGDSRAVLCKGENAIAMSQDFTPETERQRIRGLVSTMITIVIHLLLPLVIIRRIYLNLLLTKAHTRLDGFQNI